MNHENYFATQGRWFLPVRSRGDLVIDVSPIFSNPDKRPPGKNQASIHVAEDKRLPGLYKPHARQVWPGNVPVQEYEGLSFSNNIGHLDRDRFTDNPEKCLRIVHLGSSHAVACQVRPYDKYNLLLEAELGVRLGRPVEVISLGRDNGDIGANYPRFLHVASKFNPDIVLIEHFSGLQMQLHPELLRRQHGWHHEQCALDHFSYDANGQLFFAPWSPDWAAHTSKSDTSELIPGVPFLETLRVPWEHMHPLGKESFSYVRDIVRYYKERHPGPTFILHSGLDQAQARGQNVTNVKMKNGTEIPFGCSVYLRNLEDFCRKEGIPYLAPSVPQGCNETPECYLTFPQDGHYAHRGHQWLAQELADRLATYLAATKK